VSEVTRVFVLAETPEVAREWIASQPKKAGVVYAYANRWSAFIGHRSKVFFYCAGEWWRIEENEKARWWAKDNGIEEWQGAQSVD